MACTAAQARGRGIRAWMGWNPSRLPVMDHGIDATFRGAAKFSVGVPLQGRPSFLLFQGS